MSFRARDVREIIDRRTLALWRAGREGGRAEEEGKDGYLVILMKSPRALFMLIRFRRSRPMDTRQSEGRSRRAEETSAERETYKGKRWRRRRRRRRLGVAPRASSDAFVGALIRYFGRGRAREPRMRKTTSFYGWIRTACDPPAVDERRNPTKLILIRGLLGLRETG